MKYTLLPLLFTSFSSAAEETPKSASFLSQCIVQLYHSDADSSGALDYDEFQSFITDLSTDYGCSSTSATDQTNFEKLTCLCGDDQDCGCDDHTSITLPGYEEYAVSLCTEVEFLVTSPSCPPSALAIQEENEALSWVPICLIQLYRSDIDYTATLDFVEYEEFLAKFTPMTPCENGVLATKSLFNELSSSRAITISLPNKSFDEAAGVCLPIHDFLLDDTNCRPADLEIANPGNDSLRTGASGALGRLSSVAAGMSALLFVMLG